MSLLESGVHYPRSVITTALGVSVDFSVSVDNFCHDLDFEPPRLTFTVSTIGCYTPFMTAGGCSSRSHEHSHTPLLHSSLGLLPATERRFSRNGVAATHHSDSSERSKGKTFYCHSSSYVLPNFSASLFISFGQTTFENSLSPALTRFAPEVDSAEVDSAEVGHAGATDFRSIVPASSVPGVLNAFNEALTVEFVSPAWLVWESELTMPSIYLRPLRLPCLS